MMEFDAAMARVRRELEHPLGGNVEYDARDIQLLVARLDVALLDTAIVDYIESKRENWVEEDAYGNPELVAHVWEVERDRLRLAAQRCTFREAVLDEMHREHSPTFSDEDVF